MKKAVIILLLFTLLLSSCKDNDGASSEHVTTSTVSTEGESVIQSNANSNESAVEKSILDRIDNTTAYERLITKTIRMSEFIETFDRDPGKFLNGSLPHISQIDQEIGIQCIRRNKSGTLYSVHMVEEGGLLYIIYNESEHAGFTYIRNWYYVKKPLSYEDFSSIQVGSSITDVKKVDPSTDVYLERLKKFKEEVREFRTYHYLKDGILSYSYITQNGKPVVAGINFDHEFQAFNYYSAAEKIIDAEILPQDFLK